ncbi:rod shape-determining protein [Seramator thermalis]|jgi:rod shape-determining protein MreB|uniref:rod shape-determining protein n=1 Tax=Seramator thermalis TaxID=2496270 RepID=UPI00101BD494|nr:rod shape-determining protein [Seramator thermalis]HPD44297.1 rod shape-determining protein [Dysgonamonadaceae bacterium]HRU13220.1 rod shape-determining protein [Dysgonamonadaceae bacterium]
MGLFSFTQELAMDLGTANSIIVNNVGKILLDEPSIVALDRKTDKMIALGEKARQMHGKTHENIRTVRPLRDGVIADFNAAEQMIRGMIKMANKNRGNGLFSPSLRIVICIPSGSTEVEIRAVRDSAEHAGGRDVYMIFEPMAAALGIGLDVEAPEGNMIVDIGGGTTEIAVISLGGIVSNKSIKIAGDDLTEDIMEYMGRQHNMKVGERTAEQIKINVGSVLTELQDPPEDFIVHGPNRMTSLPMDVPVSYQEIAHCLEKSISKVDSAVLSALEQTPPELYADIVRNGIYLTGGGALLRGLDKRLTEKIGIPFKVVDDPLHVVAKGTGIALRNIDKFNFLMR